ncbi:MAG: hypothetical protein RIQ93_1195 [Verrucomicrobiota bacterium]
MGGGTARFYISPPAYPESIVQGMDAMTKALRDGWQAIFLPSCVGGAGGFAPCDAPVVLVARHVIPHP